jgi:hypothetical protein
MTYDMYTKSGNLACERLVSRISKKVNGRIRLTRDDVVKMLSEGVSKIAEKHPEVNDTEPEWALVENVNLALELAGYGYKMERSDL